jgi:hypothetical protein
MRPSQCMLGIVLAVAFLAGCGKSQQQQAPPPIAIRGVKVDLPKLQQVFSSQKPELSALAAEAASDIRYGKNAEALAILQKLAADPSLPESLKTVVSDVIGQVTQVAAKAPRQ